MSEKFLCELCVFVRENKTRDFAKRLQNIKSLLALPHANQCLFLFAFFASSAVKFNHKNQVEIDENEKAVEGASETPKKSKCVTLVSRLVFQVRFRPPCCFKKLP